MSTTWIRGARCGIDNCRSRHYRSIDGRRICQYGHVNESHVEFNDEEDNFQEGGNIIRKHRLGGSTPSASQVTTQGKKGSELWLYGSAGRELFVYCFQYVLRRQVEDLTKMLDLPPVFKTVVMKYWIQYMKEGYTGDRGDLGNWIDAELRASQKLSWQKVTPPFIDTLVILYLAIRYLKLPFYICDLLNWISMNKIPYCKASVILPNSLKQRMQPQVLTKFQPEVLPSTGQLHDAIAIVISNLKIRHLSLNYHPLVYRVVTRLLLPLETYHTVDNLINARGIRLDFAPWTHFTTSSSRITYSPELLVVALVINAAKNLFARQGSTGIYGLQWKDAYEAYQKNNKGHYSVDLLVKDINIKDDPDIFDWDEEKTNDYLDWFEKYIVAGPDHTEKKDIMKRRLYNIFPLDPCQEKAKDGQEEPTITSEEQEGEETEIKTHAQSKIKPKKRRRGRPRSLNNKISLQLHQLKTIKDVYKYLSQAPTATQSDLNIHNFRTITPLMVSQIHSEWGVTAAQLETTANAMEKYTYWGMFSNKYISTAVNGPTARGLNNLFGFEEVMTCDEINQIMKEKS